MLMDKGNTIKLCDLGLARFTNNGNDITFRKVLNRKLVDDFQCKGTPLYMAPEVYHSALEMESQVSWGIMR